MLELLNIECKVNMFNWCGDIRKRIDSMIEEIENIKINSEDLKNIR